MLALVTDTRPVLASRAPRDKGLALVVLVVRAESAPGPAATLARWRHVRRQLGILQLHLGRGDLALTLALAQIVLVHLHQVRPNPATGTDLMALALQPDPGVTYLAHAGLYGPRS